MDIFRNRRAAAIQLAERLERYRGKDAVILAIPRGGVPVGREIADRLDLPLDLALAKKIGHPSNSEYAIGAVCYPDIVLVNDFAAADAAYVQEETERLKKSLEARRRKFMGTRPMAAVQGRTVILVDDGIATGFTIRAVMQMLRRQGAAKVVVAVPVSPADTAAEMRELADEFICLVVPHHFSGVGQVYEDFTQVEDEEVVRMVGD